MPAECVNGADSDVGDGQIWTVQDIAGYLRCSREQVRRLIVERDLPAFDIGLGGKQHEWRAYPEEIVAWTKRIRLRALAPAAGGEG